MLERMRTRMAYGNVMATVAMFLALSGSAVAAGKKLVRGSDIQNGSLTGQDIKDKSVPGAKIMPGSLTGTNFKDKSITGGKIAPGSVTGKNVKPGSLTGSNLKSGSLSGDKIKPGSLTQELFAPGQWPTGGKGDKGSKGDKGDKGEPGTVDTSRFYDKGDVDAKFVQRVKTGGATDLVKFSGPGSCQALGTDVSQTVDVGPSGLVAVYAEAEISDQTQEQAKVQLYEPSSLSSCPQILLGGSVDPGFELKRTTPASPGGTTGLGAPLIAHVAPGTRTFSLRVGADSAGVYQIRNRTLWVQPL
jgi:hypothetical protein